MIPAIRQAINDPELKGSLRVYLYLAEYVLDLVEYRPVKHVAVASPLKIHRTKVTRALQTLTEGGYLERADGPDDRSEVRLYRLRYTRMCNPAHTNAA